MEYFLNPKSAWIDFSPLLSAMLHLSIPTFFTIFLEIIIPLVTTMMIGRLGEKYLAAGSLGGMIVNASGYSITFGMASALDMMCSHAFGSKVGLYAQRGKVILTLLCIPIVLGWLFTEKLLILCNVNEEIAHLAYIWVKWQILTIFPITMENAFRRFLASQTIVYPQIFGTIFGTVIHVILTYILVNKTDLGFLGAIIVIPITYWIMLVVIVLGYVVHYMYYKRLYQSTNFESIDTTNNVLFSDLSITSTTDEEGEEKLNIKMNNNKSINSLDMGIFEEQIDKQRKENELNELSKKKEEYQYQGVNNSDEEEIEENSGNEKEKSKIKDDDIDISEEEIDNKNNTSHYSNDKLLSLETWPSLSLSIFYGWKEFLWLGVPAAVSLFLEWGSFEVNAIFISLSIPNSSLANSSVPIATHALLCNTSIIWYVFPAAISVAATTLIGNSLGAGEHKNASRYAIISFIFVVLYAILNGIAAIFYKQYWFMMWTDFEPVLDMSRSCMWIMWFYSISDCIKCVGISVVRGCGKYVHSVFVNAFSCIVFGYPISYILGVHLGYGIQGVWFGMSCAWTMASIIYCIIIYRIDWEQEAIESLKRTKEGLQSIVQH